MKSAHALSRYQHGFSYLEMVMFIVIIGITASVLMWPFQQSLQGQAKLLDQTDAINLTQTRLNLNLGERYITGYSGLTDFCSTHSASVACAIPTGLSVETDIDQWDEQSEYKLITVTVSGQANASAQLIVGQYSE